MRVIGITGGVGAGKSYVARLLETEFGAVMISTDLVARQMMERGQDCWKQVVEAFGTGILEPDGEINRKKLAGIIFQDSGKRLLLNSIVHPAVKEAVKHQISEADARLVAVESALLVEDRYDQICDELWYVYAPEEERIRRLMTERGYSREKCRDMMKSQLSEAEFRAACQVVIDNGKDDSQIKEQLEHYLKNKEAE